MNQSTAVESAGIGDLRSAPGKTFLVGEYLALDGGPSLIICTAPRFTLKTFKSVAGKRNSPFAPQSPAGRFMARHKVEFENLRFEFHDPHRGKGGLGASSAQFALAYTWFLNQRSVEPADFDWQALLEEYRACAWSGEGLPPSGADVVAQLTGQISWFDGREHIVRKLQWPFKSLGFTLIRTGTKLATHEHLVISKTAKAAPHDALRELVREATLAFEGADEKRLLDSVNESARVLLDSELTARGTLGLLTAMKADGDWALAAKGCGAMGADVILVLHDLDRANEVELWAEKKDLEICGNLATLAEGLAVRPRRGSSQKGEK
jgi:mevalonate kinase